MSKKEMTAFLIYYDNEIVVCRLPDEEAGQLFKSLFPYARENIVPDFENSPALAMAFDILSMAIDKNKEYYETKCEKNRRNIVKRWNKEDTTVYDGIQSNDSNTKDTNNKNKTKNKPKTKNNNITVGAELEAPARPSVIKLSLNDGTEHDIYQEDVSEWMGLYPAVDIIQELRKMKGWLDANPKNRKTKRGIKRFINGWLSKEQDRAKKVQQPVPARTQISENRFHNFEQRNYDYDDLESQFIHKVNQDYKKEQ